MEEMHTQTVFINEEAKPARSFSMSDCVFAWLSVLAGYLFCRAFPVGGHPLGGFLLVLFLFVSSTVMLKVNGFAFKALPLTVAISGVIVSATLIFSGNAFFRFCAYAYALAAYVYYLYATTGNSIRSGFCDLIAADFIKALFVMPFASFDALFKGMFTGKAKNSAKVLAKLLVGIAIAIVPTAIVLALLSYDSAFSDLLGKIFSFSVDDVFSQLFSVMFAVPIGAYLFGMGISSIDRKCADVPPKEAWGLAAERMRVAPTLTLLAATLPLAVIYVIFFVSQWQYYLSGFTGVLPDNFSYATYAREGFFQLCAVSVINLVMIVAAMMFARRKASKPSVFLRILVCMFSAMTLVLISTAIAKMVMYIDYYGLTQKRVYATWFMVLIAIVFVVLAVKQFALKLPALAVSMAVTVVMFAFLSLSGVNGFIASYNVDRYLDGSLKTVDVAMLENLGDEAVPDLVRLHGVLQRDTDRTNKETALYGEVKSCLRRTADRLDRPDNGWTTMTVPRLKAAAALKTGGF